MKNEKLSSSLFGYSKKAVHEYLAEMSTKSEEELNKYAGEVKSAQDEIESLKAENKKGAAEIAKLRERIEDNDILNKQYMKEIGDAKAELARLTEMVKNLTDEKNALSASLSAIEAEKAAISAALISARQKADSIVEGAKMEADDVMQKLAIEREEQLRIAAIDMENAKAAINKTTGELVSLKQEVIAAMNKYKSELEYIISEYKM
ncbi:MAG: hypothetical protein IKC41_03270 [Clostridia bacterium]|nr:hypothetical protein [Clostridia bacterium]MBR2877842.1 hypothetical protein [Clostridia bacterium]MBR2973216.1 hypothetical protein [Clostridia bacterium]